MIVMNLKKKKEQLKIIWESSEIQLPKPDKEKAWKSVKERINTEKFNQSTKQKNVKFSQWWINSKFLKIAAILLVILTTAYFIYQTNSLEKIHYNEIVV